MPTWGAQDPSSALGTLGQVQLLASEPQRASKVESNRSMNFSSASKSLIIYFIWFLSFSSTLGICFSLPEHVMVSPLMRTHIPSCWSLQTLSIPGTQSNTPSSNPPQVHWGCVSIDSPAKWTPMGSQPCPYSVLHARASRLHTICHPLLWSHSYSVFSVNLWLIIRSAFHKPTSMHVHVHTHTSITCKTLL